MSLLIRTVRDKGDLNSERIVLYAESNVDIGQYILFDTTYIDEVTISDKLRYCFWLPNLKINVGDLVVIYTKSGTQKQKNNDDKSTTQFFYWGLDEPVWNKGEDCAVLMKIEDWSMKLV